MYLHTFSMHIHIHVIQFCRSNFQTLVYHASFPWYQIPIQPHPARNIHSDLTPSKIQMCFYIYVGRSTKTEAAYGIHRQSGLYHPHYRENVKNKSFLLHKCQPRGVTRNQRFALLKSHLACELAFFDGAMGIKWDSHLCLGPSGLLLWSELIQSCLHPRRFEKLT